MTSSVWALTSFMHIHLMFALHAFQFLSQGFLVVQFSHSVVSDSWQPHGLQHTSLPCPSPTPRACSNSCPSSQWCHPTISPSVIPFSSCLQSFLASGSFPMSQFFPSGGQSIGASASASVLPMNNTTVQKYQFSFYYASINPKNYDSLHSPPKN